jgi:hypothetical protein
MHAYLLIGLLLMGATLTIPLAGQMLPASASP